MTKQENGERIESRGGIEYCQIHQRSRSECGLYLGQQHDYNPSIPKTIATQPTADKPEETSNTPRLKNPQLPLDWCEVHQRERKSCGFWIGYEHGQKPQ